MEKLHMRQIGKRIATTVARKDARVAMARAEWPRDQAELSKATIKKGTKE
jgi:hypothetical protein